MDRPKGERSWTKFSRSCGDQFRHVDVPFFPRTFVDVVDVAAEPAKFDEALSALGAHVLLQNYRDKQTKESQVLTKAIPIELTVKAW